MTGKSNDSNNEKLEIYKLLVEMADRVSQRRQSANSFYLTVNTALIGGSSFLTNDTDRVWPILTMAAAGFFVSALWIWNIKSYKTLNEAKFKVIHDLENELPFQAYKLEWEALDPDGDGKRHKPFHKIETIVPILFIVVYFIHLSLYIPWDIVFSRR